MASRLVQNGKAEVILSQTKAADLDGLLAEHHSLPSLVGATSTTLRSVGLILALVAILALGKTVCFPSAALTENVVQRANAFDQAAISYGCVVSRSQENLHLDSSVELSDSGEESGALNQLVHDLFSSPGDNTALLPTFNHDPDHDLHLTGSQFGLDGLPNFRGSAGMPFDGCNSVTCPSVVPDEDQTRAQPADILEVVDSYHNIDFDFTVGALKDDGSVSAASMAVLVDQDELHD
ncbi:hypothetical protein PG996_007816 [Apiospora saccharicola]|uniref:Uncharacterized protein n=1 Tax=Apiospora saccharicola TaxID=335842 RepID=A0ABR1UW61_9PEZI